MLQFPENHEKTVLLPIVVILQSFSGVELVIIFYHLLRYPNKEIVVVLFDFVLPHTRHKI
jgi:hypothetical protein